MGTLEAVMTKAYSFLQREWVCQFLLDSHANEDLSLLTAHDKLQYANSGTFCILSTGGAAVKGCGAASAEEARSDWVTVPALGIEEMSAHILILRLPDGKMRLMHQITNSDTGDTIGISMDPAKGTCEMMLIIPGKDGFRQRNYLRMPVDTLRKPNSAAAARSVLFRSFSDERRACTSCASTCDCPLPPPLSHGRVRHPLDFATVARNSVGNGGIYSGTLTNTIFLGGEAYSTPPNAIFGGIESGSAAGVMPDLVAWSVRISLSNGLSIATPTAYPALTPVPEGSDGATLGVAGPGLQFFDATDNFLDASGVDSVLDSQTAVQLTLLAPHSDVIGDPFQHVDASSRALSISTSQRLQRQPHAPAPPASAVGTNHASSGGSRPSGGKAIDEEKMRERQRKAYQRKLRNRESAARCNRRNQLAKAELEKALLDEKQKLKALSDKLTAMQEENKSLRSAVEDDSHSP